MKYQKNTKMYQLLMHNLSSQRITDIGGYICVKKKKSEFFKCIHFNELYSKKNTE